MLDEDNFNIPTKESNASCVKKPDVEHSNSLGYRFPTMKLFPMLLDSPINYNDIEVLLGSVILLIKLILYP